MLLRVFKRKSVRKIDGPTKEEESWRIRTNKEIEDTLTGVDIVKFIHLLRLRWYGHTERLNKKRLSKQIGTARMEGARKRRSTEKMD